MHVVLVHGWGFDAHIFDALVPYLPDAEITIVDLGFLRRANIPDAWPQDAIAVGHSLGLLWLLREGQGRFSGLVSLQGFDCFSCHVEPARIAFMRRSLKRDPYGLMQLFWRSCGIETFAEPEALDVERLDQGLQWLTDWNETERRQALQMPILALASKDDPIVPEAMSRAIWGDALIWTEPAGHLLPLRHPEFCARHILGFAAEISAP